MAQGTSAERDHFRVYVAGAIVAVSVVGALVSFNASKASEDAGAKAQQAIQERQLQERGHELSQFLLSLDLQHLGPLQESSKQADLLLAQAKSASGGLASSLRVEAERKQLEASTIRRYLLDRAAFNDKRLTYDRGLALADFEAKNSAVNTLRPERTRTAANSARAKTVRLVSSAAGLAAALFALTLAQLTSPPRRRVFAGVGGALAVGSGVAAFVLVVT